MASAALVLLGLIVTGLVDALAAPAKASGATAASQDVTTGKQLFLANCSTCHGTNAEGRQYAPSLIGVGAASVDFQVGTGRMPLQAGGPQAPSGRKVSFSDDEVKALAAYVASLSPGPAIPSADAVDPAKGDSVRGGDLFRTNCAMCHNFAGKGGALTRGKYAPDLSNTSPTHMYEAMVTGPQNMPVFSDTNLDPKSKQDVIAFIRTINEAPSPGGLNLGGIGPVSEGLVAWIVGLAALIGCAVWLGAKAS
jgi:ubiquinol-cytochrome c reductase cytochrome c subunit